MAEKMKKVLEELKLDHLIPNFKREKIDIDIFLSLTEDQLNRLGINTLWEKGRLNKKVQSELDEADESETGKTEKGLVENTPCGSKTTLVQQRNLLFGRGKKSKSTNRKINIVDQPKKKKSKI